MSRITKRVQLKKSTDETREVAKDYARARVLSARADLLMYVDAAIEGLLGADVLSPLTGETVTIEKHITIIAPDAGLAELTIAFPAGVDGRRCRIASTRAIADLTYSPAPGDTVVGQVPYALAAGGFFELYYVGSASTWVRIG